MKFATFAAAALFAAGILLYASDPVKIGDKYYYEDAAGNLILAPEGSVREAPKRRPLRSGKYGMPHPYSWHAQTGETPSPKTNFELSNFLKGLDLDGIQNGVNSLQRVLSLLQDMSTNKPNTNPTNYKPRPIYKHFED